MAYTHSKYNVQVPMATGPGIDVTVTGTGDVAKLHMGIMPHIVRAVTATVLTTGVGATAPVISVRDNTTVGAASTTGQQFATINLTTGPTQGQVFYRDALDQEVSETAELVFNVTTAATGPFNVRLGAYVEPRWEAPGNQTMTTG